MLRAVALIRNADPWPAFDFASYITVKKAYTDEMLQ